MLAACLRREEASCWIAQNECSAVIIKATKESKKANKIKIKITYKQESREHEDCYL